MFHRPGLELVHKAEQGAVWQSGGQSPALAVVRDPIRRVVRIIIITTPFPIFVLRPHPIMRVCRLGDEMCLLKVVFPLSLFRLISVTLSVSPVLELSSSSFNGSAY